VFLEVSSICRLSFSLESARMWAFVRFSAIEGNHGPITF